VSLVHDQDIRPHGHGRADQLLDAPDQPQIISISPASVWLARSAPFCLPPLTIGVEKGAIGASRGKFADRRLAEVMDEHVLSTADVVPSHSHPHGVVIIFKQANSKLLVERTDARVHVTPQCGAEHGDHADFKTATLMCFGITTREPYKFTVRPVRGF